MTNEEQTINNDSIELSDLLENPSEALKTAYTNLKESIDVEPGPAAESAERFATALLAEGTQIVRDFLTAALTLLQTSGVLEALSGTITRGNRILEKLGDGVEAFLTMPTRDQARYLAIITVLLLAPGKLLTPLILRNMMANMA